MTPEEIMQAYDVLVQEGNDYAAREAAKVGNSQRSLGGLAEVVANPSGQTSGLANYTYNRTMRPTVDSLATSLTTTGKSQAMDRYLKDELMKAKNAYEDAKNAYTVASTTPKTSGSGGVYREQTDTEYTGEQEPETVENTDQVVTGTSMLPWGNGAGGYIMLGTPWGGEGTPGQYVFQDSSGHVFYMDLPEDHEFVVDPDTGGLTTRKKTGVKSARYNSSTGEWEYEYYD